jgi:hypothetical protein
MAKKQKQKISADQVRDEAKAAWGTPYTLDEAKAALAAQRKSMDPYHAELLEWALGMISSNPLGKALAEFVDVIEATGGVAKDDAGLHAPMADPEWIDLGEAYVRACAVLGKESVVAVADDELHEPCEDCGETTGVEHQPCPYESDLHGDNTLVWLCEECANKRAMEL